MGKNLLVEQARWCIWKCKKVLRMTDTEVSEVLGVSRPTFEKLKNHPEKMGTIQLIKLQEHLKTTGHMLKETELS